MIFNPQAIRTEAHLEVGRRIEQNVGTSIERWCRRAVAEQPNAQRVHTEELLDQLAA